MAGVLAVLTVGTQEVQSDYLDEFVHGRLGPHAKVEGRAIGDHLAELDDEDLRAVVSDDTVRNGPCLRRLHEETGGAFALLLFGTDQADERFRRSDTIGIARQLERWLALTQPQVRVLEPVALSGPPHLATQALEDQIAAAVDAAVAETQPDEVVCMPVGGTPAMRLLLEHVAGLRAGPSAKVRRLQPDGHGGCTDQSLLTLLEAHHVRNTMLDRIEAAFESGRFDASAEVARSMRRLGMTFADDLETIAERAGALPGPGGSWRERFEVELALTRRAEKDGRRLEVLVRWGSAAELLPAVWAARHVGEPPQDGLARSIECRQRRCAVAYRTQMPPHELGKPGQRPREEARLYRGAAICVQERCDSCPLRDAADEVGEVAALWQDRARARIAGWLRDLGPRHMIDLRHREAHAIDLEATDLATAVEREATQLPDHARDQLQVGKPGPADLLAVVFRAITGQSPDDPFRELASELSETIASART